MLFTEIRYGKTANDPLLMWRESCGESRRKRVDAGMLLVNLENTRIL